MGTDALTSAEVAELLRVTTSAVTAWCRTSKLPAYRVGSRWRIRKEDLDAFVRNGIPRLPEGQIKTAQG